MNSFHILFDHGEHSELLDPVYAPYGKLGFPHPPADRPWISSNFVQTIDGIVSLLGDDSSGCDIAQSAEDRWLMDLLRAHADALIIGLGTLEAERRLERPRPRGPVFRIMDDALRQLRAKLHRGPERNVFVTTGRNLKLDNYAVFDGDKVEPYVVTTEEGAQDLQSQLSSHPEVKVVAAGRGTVDLSLAMRQLRQQFGWKYLLCEGGPSLYGNMLRDGLIDEQFLTVAPYMAGQWAPGYVGSAPTEALRPTLVGGPGFAKDEMVRWEWLSCRKVGDHQFHRFRRREERH